MASKSPKLIAEDLDPRIQVELEKLNKASHDINKLELELERVRNNFRQILTGSTQQLNDLSKSLGSSIDKARPYYDARIKAKEAQLETQNAALRFERACGQLVAAKETVTVAEEGFFNKGQCFDPAWQEMLNHATMKVNDAEKERLESELEHEATARGFTEVEREVKELYRDLKKHIQKSKPYFELKARFTQAMQEQKTRADTLENGIVLAKHNYSETLHCLEKISDEIHLSRQEAKIRQEMGPRSSGVGAETPFPSVGREIPSPKVDISKENPSATKNENTTSFKIESNHETESASVTTNLKDDIKATHRNPLQSNTTDGMHRQQDSRKGSKARSHRRSYEEAIQTGPSDELVLRSDLLRHHLRHNISSQRPLQHPSFTPKHDNPTSQQQHNAEKSTPLNRDCNISTSATAANKSDITHTTVKKTSQNINVEQSSQSKYPVEPVSEPKSVFSLLSSLKKRVSKANTDANINNKQSDLTRNTSRDEIKVGDNKVDPSDKTGLVTQHLVKHTETAKETSFVVNETVRETSGKEELQSDLDGKSQKTITVSSGEDNLNDKKPAGTEFSLVKVENNLVECSDLNLPSKCISLPQNVIAQSSNIKPESVAPTSQCMSVAPQVNSSQVSRDAIGSHDMNETRQNNGVYHVNNSITNAHETGQAIDIATGINDSKATSDALTEDLQSASLRKNDGEFDSNLSFPVEAEEELSDSDSRTSGNVLDDDQIERALTDFDDTAANDNPSQSADGDVTMRESGIKRCQEDGLQDYKTLPARLSYLQEYVTCGSVTDELSIEVDNDVFVTHTENIVNSREKRCDDGASLTDISENKVSSNDMRCVVESVSLNEKLEIQTD